MQKIEQKVYDLFHANTILFSDKLELAKLFQEVGDKACVPHLVEEISNPKNEAVAAEMIFLLSHFDCADLFVNLFTWALVGDDEAANEAFCIIEDQCLYPTQDELTRCMDFIVSSEKEDEENAEFFDYMKTFLQSFSQKSYHHGQRYLH